MKPIDPSWTLNVELILSTDDSTPREDIFLMVESQNYDSSKLDIRKFFFFNIKIIIISRN